MREWNETHIADDEESEVTLLRELIVVAAVIHGEPMTLKKLRQFLIGRNLAKFKLPDELMLVSNLPKTAVGKVDKKAILGTSGAS